MLNDPNRPPEARTLFQILDPRGVEEEVFWAEKEILESLRERAFLRTGIKNVDYLVDQWRFAKAARAQAERRGFRGLAALEWASYLSWPECSRQAETGWRRDLLRRYAFEEPAPWWQRALDARSPNDPVNTGPPRKDVWLPPKLLFGPYPSDWGPTALAPACLEADITFDAWTTPCPLTPVRRLNPALIWTLRISAARLYAGVCPGFLELVIDEPRTYSAAEAGEALIVHAQQCETTLHAATTGPTPIPAEAAGQWRNGIERLWTAATAVSRPGTRARATLLESLFSVPGTLWPTPVEVLTDDLPPEWFGVMLGFAFERRGALSVRDKRRLHRSAQAVFDDWQATHYPDREIMPDRTALVVSRLADVRRLLQPKSLFAYLAKLTRSRPGLGRRSPSD